MAKARPSIAIDFDEPTTKVSVDVDYDVGNGIVKIVQDPDRLFIPLAEFDDFIGALIKWKETVDGNA